MIYVEYDFIQRKNAPIKMAGNFSSEDSFEGFMRSQKEIGNLIVKTAQKELTSPKFPPYAIWEISESRLA